MRRAAAAVSVSAAARRARALACPSGLQLGRPHISVGGCHGRPLKHAAHSSLKKNATASSITKSLQ